MAQNLPPWPRPEHPPTNQDRKLSRRWLVIGGLVIALLLGGAAAVYAGIRFAQGPESSAAGPPSADPQPADTSIPEALLPFTDLPPNPGRVFCGEVNSILNDLVSVDLVYVEIVRDIADRLSRLDAPSPTHQAALDELVNEFEAAAQMVEDDPTAEEEAVDRDMAAQSAFLESGGCDPTG